MVREDDEGEAGWERGRERDGEERVKPGWLATLPRRGEISTV